MRGRLCDHGAGYTGQTPREPARGGRKATGGMDAFDGAVEAGVSHEPTEALVALVRGGEGARRRSR
ncbi:hypothetical protein SipoB123_41235 [Streptomyces ipomoeae]|nr:hypothetical protein SipoB123_41235 [Streptomyces ipomoeae]